MRSISLDVAVKIINGTFVSGEKHRLRPLSTVVLDAGGRVKAYLKQDFCTLLRFEISYGKAYASLTVGRASKLILNKARLQPHFVRGLESLADGPIFLEGGGQLIRDPSGEIVGAVGVTGDYNEMDDVAAMDGIRAAGLKCDSDFTDPEDQRRMNIWLVTGSREEGDPARLPKD